MVTETIHITPEGELAAALEKAAEAPVILEANGIRYHLSRADTHSPDAPEAIRDVTMHLTKHASRCTMVPYGAFDASGSEKVSGNERSDYPQS